MTSQSGTSGLTPAPGFPSPDDPGPLRAAHTPNFPALLRQLGASLLVTTYQAGKLVMVRDEGDHLNTHYRAFKAPMGLALAEGGASTTAGTATITNFLILGNRVDSLFAALGGGIDCENSTLSLTNCAIIANQAKGANAYGGGIYAVNSTVTVKQSLVIGNKATGTVEGKGGGIYSLNSLLTLLASLVKGNKATNGFDNIFNGP